MANPETDQNPTVGAREAGIQIGSRLVHLQLEIAVTGENADQGERRELHLSGGVEEMAPYAM